MVGFGHKRVKVGMGKTEQESLCLGLKGRSEQGRKQLSSILALNTEKSGVKTNNNSNNNNNKVAILKTDYPMAGC